MTSELWYLFLTTVLLTVLWIPYIIGSVQTAASHFQPGPRSESEPRVEARLAAATGGLS